MNEDELDWDLGFWADNRSEEELIQEAKDLAFEIGYDDQKPNFDENAKAYAKRANNSVYDDIFRDIEPDLLEQYRLGHLQASVDRQANLPDTISDRLDGDEYTDLLDEKQYKQVFK